MPAPWKFRQSSSQRPSALRGCGEVGEISEKCKQLSGMYLRIQVIFSLLSGNTWWLTFLAQIPRARICDSCSVMTFQCWLYKTELVIGFFFIQAMQKDAILRTWIPETNRRKNRLDAKSKEKLRKNQQLRQVYQDKVREVEKERSL